MIDLGNNDNETDYKNKKKVTQEFDEGGENERWEIFCENLENT